jgi:hypothetical protein
VNRVPWAKWTQDQKTIAMYDYREARRGELSRIMDPAARKDKDQEAKHETTLRLLDPYKDDIKKFDLARTYTSVISTPYDRARPKTNVTFTATVTMLDRIPPAGRVRFDVTNGLWQQTLGNAQLVNGTASLTTNVLPKGKVTVLAEYFPYTDDASGSQGQVPITIADDTAQGPTQQSQGQPQPSQAPTQPSQGQPQPSQPQPSQPPPQRSETVP